MGLRAIFSRSKVVTPLKEDNISEGEALLEVLDSDLGTNGKKATTKVEDATDVKGEAKKLYAKGMHQYKEGDWCLNMSLDSFIILPILVGYGVAGTVLTELGMHNQTKAAKKLTQEHLEEDYRRLDGPLKNPFKDDLSLADKMNILINNVKNSAVISDNKWEKIHKKYDGKPVTKRKLKRAEKEYKTALKNGYLAKLDKEYKADQKEKKA